MIDIDDYDIPELTDYEDNFREDNQPLLVDFIKNLITARLTRGPIRANCS